VNDPRFEAIFSNHKFNIDPSDQQFKKTRAMEELLEAKNKRKIAETDRKEAATDVGEEDSAKKSRNDTAAASLLVSSIKSKTEAMARRKKEIKDRQNKIKFAMLK
jgi:hypothetical protein